jgi:hypothetical protein
MKQIAACLILFLMISCSTGKKLTYEELMEGAPSWAKQTPNSAEYYHGVGMVSKITSPVDYREIARQNALSEIASAISVNISSTSVLNQFEYDDKYTEFYRDNIRMTTQQQLEGYELVDNWENQQQYWVYYRLSKSRFDEIKQQRISKALEASRSGFDKARDFKAEGNFVESMRFYIKSLDGIQNFLGDDLKTEIDGKEENYSGLLISEIIRMVPRLSIETGQELVYTRGAGHEQETTTLQVLYDNQYPVKGVAVRTEFSYAPGKTIEKVSDADGIIRIKNENFDTNKKQEFIRSSANINELIKENTNDQMVRRLLESIKFPVYVFPIRIVSPKFYLVSEEKNLGHNISGSRVNREFRSLLQRAGFEVVDDEKQADFILFSNVNTQQGTEVNGKFSTRLNAAFTLKNSDGQVVHSRVLDDVNGLGAGFESAGEDAYRSLEGKIRINVYPKMYDAVFK